MVISQMNLIHHSEQNNYLSPSSRSVFDIRRIATMIPPPVLLFLAILSIQLGAATAKNLFAALGAPGVVFLRLGFAAIVLWLIARPNVREYSRQQWTYAALLGVVTALLNTAFYLALVRLPLGIVVAVEFLGPLSVAVIGSRKLVDFVWPLLALAGILLLAPFGSMAAFDPIGLLLAFFAAVVWAGHILITARTSVMFSGVTGLALAMTVSALVAMPLGIASGGMALLNISLLFEGFLVAMLSTTIPYALEFIALKRMPPRTYGILVSSEPAVAALIGFVLLHEVLGVRGWIALGLVSLASVGVTLYGKTKQE